MIMIMNYDLIIYDRWQISWLRSVANFMALLSSKAVQRATKSNATVPKKVADRVREALTVARDHNLDVPAGLVAIATKMTT